MKLKLKKNVKKVLQVFIIAILILLCIAFLKSRVTYTSYETSINGNISSPIASWRINIDGKDISTLSTEGLTINSINWITNNVREGKVAPGSVGDMKIVVDPTGTDVAIYFELEIIDKSVDESKFLKVTNISVANTDVELRRIAVNKYAGILTLDDISSGIKPEIDIDVIWESLEDVEYNPNVNDNLDAFLVFNFNAKQYGGEELPAEYTE